MWASHSWTSWTQDGTGVSPEVCLELTSRSSRSLSQMVSFKVKVTENDEMITMNARLKLAVQLARTGAAHPSHVFLSFRSEHFKNKLDRIHPISNNDAEFKLRPAAHWDDADYKYVHKNLTETTQTCSSVRRNEWILHYLASAVTSQFVCCLSIFVYVA